VDENGPDDLRTAAAENAGPGVIQYYDNNEDEATTSRPGEAVEHDVDVDRVYGINYDMTDEQWRRLDEIYRALPGSSAELGSAAWFGAEGAPSGWLAASAEPSGLQVFGRLPVVEWQRWSAAFQTAIDGADFPRIDYGDSALRLPADPAP